MGGPAAQLGSPTPAGPAASGRPQPSNGRGSLASVPDLPAPSQPATGSERPSSNADRLAAAHARFARAALGIYLAAAALSVALLVAALVTDKAHDEEQIREQLFLQTDVRASSLSQRLGLLGDELRRLSQRSEVDLGDRDLAPEKSLLQISHERSAFFNVGVAILDRRGEVIWSEPSEFLAHGPGFGRERWFGGLQQARAFRIVPVQPDKPDSVLYVVSPLIKAGAFTGALLGAVDLARGQPLAPEKPSSHLLTVVATTAGEVVYPPVPPAFAAEPGWRGLFGPRALQPFTVGVTLDGVRAVVASSPVIGSELVLMSVGTEQDLFQQAWSRLRLRLSAALVLALSPALLLLLLLQRSLKVFRRSEEAAVREERLRLLGEAANSIAHEVKNSLNGLSMGLDLVVRAVGDPPGPVSRPGGLTRGPIPPERRERIVNELRREIQRLSEFTTELMTFSRGVSPRRSTLDLSDFVPKVTGLLLDSTEELGGEIEVSVPPRPVWVEADGALLHAVISNLAGNAIDAAIAGSPAPRVQVRLEAGEREALLRVSDNGKGVSASMKPRLFEPFESEKHNGVGIGLALARKIARAHGGELILDEQGPERPGFPGASFVLTLPLMLEVDEP